MGPGWEADKMLLAGVRGGVGEAITTRALFVDPAKEGGGEALSTKWPSVSVHYIWGNRSHWIMVWAVWRLQKDVAERKTKRPVTFACLEGGNHSVSK